VLVSADGRCLGFIRVKRRFFFLACLVWCEWVKRIQATCGVSGGEMEMYSFCPFPTFLSFLFRWLYPEGRVKGIPLCENAKMIYYNNNNIHYRF
jgi:hypothetical protein